MTERTGPEDIHVTDPLGNVVIIPGNTHFGDGFTSICDDCSKSPLTCESEDVRQVPDPTAPVSFIPIPWEGSTHYMPMVKHIDGVQAGLIESEDDCNHMIMCEFFESKEKE